MKVFRGVDDLPAFKNGILTIGTFDGVHCGHQTIINRINDIEEKYDGESIILTFHPHPRLVLNPNDTSLKLINTLDEKIELLDHYGIDNLVIAPFSKEFAESSAESYVRDFLWEKFRPKRVVIGYNHHFGNNREGNIGLLENIGDELGFGVEEIEKQIVDHLGVSSTKIRNAITNGEIETANHLLGHYFSFAGKVIKGDNRGKTLGFPTANVLVEDANKLIPGNGVYAVQATIDKQQYGAMLNIGQKPTFNGTSRSIEAHIFDFDDDIYGTVIDIELVEKIRDEKKFESADDLVVQLKDDQVKAQSILSNVKQES